MEAINKKTHGTAYDAWYTDAYASLAMPFWHHIVSLMHFLGGPLLTFWVAPCLKDVKITIIISPYLFVNISFKSDYN